jgi:hypothetical protein
MKASLVSIAGAALLMATGASAAQWVYPAKGQDAATQAKDETECATWAKQQTGFDPATAPKSNGAIDALMGSQVQGSNASAITSALGGGAGGAGALGSAAGMVGGDIGGIPTSQVVGVASQVMAQQKSATPAKPGQADYDQARGACLQGRGYSVK